MLKRGNFRLFSVLSTIGVVAALLVGIAGGAAGAGVDPDRTGLQDPATATWTVHNKTPFVFGNPGDAAFMGDWDCDGVDTPGLYRAVSTSSGPAGKVYLRNSATSGIADLEFFYGNPNDVPIAGDFNDDGCDTVSLYRPSTQTVHIANRLGSAGQGIGSADITYTFSPAGTPIAGDWDGDGTDTVGMWLDSTGQFVLRNSHSSDAANDVAFYFGQSGDRPVAGDFLGQASSTVGVYRHAAAKFFLRDPGNPAQEVTFPGAPNSQPLSWAPSPNPGGVAGIPASTLPRGKKNAARVLLENLVDSGTLSTQNRKTVNKAIVRILDSLDPTLWFNDAYLDDAGGNHVFDRERQAAVELEKVFGVDPTIDNALNLLVMADRTLAANAIAVAVASGGDQTDINQANARLADGDAHDAADEHPEAIGDYKKAWQAAQKAAQGINRFPIAADDAGAGFVTDEDTAFVTASVFGNDFDLDNDPLSIVSVDTTGTQGTVSHAGGGTFNYDPGAAFQSLSTSQFATDTFSYVVGDGNGGTDTAVVVITVTGINDPPTAVDDPFATTEDEVARGAVLANDSDP